MISNPIFTVIIPCYNTPEEYIFRAYNSIVKQGDISREIIIIDDGSLSEYHEPLERIAAKDDSVKLITMENAGVSNARNIAVSKANGEYIVFLDSDDVLVDGCFDRAYSIAKQTNADYIIGGVKNAVSIEDNTTVIEFSNDPKYTIYTCDEVSRLKPCFIGPDYQFCYPDYYINRGPVARLIKSKIAKSVKFDTNVKIGEDVIWNEEILNQCNMVCIVNEIWYIYWHNAASASNSYSKKTIEEWEVQLKALEEVIDLDNVQMFSSYCNRILEGLKNIWNGYLKEIRKSDKKLYKDIKHRLFYGYPWNRLAETSRIQNNPGKMKVKSLLYKGKMLLPVYEIKERIKRL